MPRLADITLEVAKGIVDGGEERYFFIIHYNNEKYTTHSDEIGYVDIRSMIQDLAGKHLTGEHDGARFLVKDELPSVLVPADSSWNFASTHRFARLNQSEIDEIYGRLDDLMS